MTATDAVTTKISSTMLSYLNSAIDDTYYNTLYYASAEWETYSDSSNNIFPSHLLLLLSLCGAATAVLMHSISTGSTNSEDKNWDVTFESNSTLLSSKSSSSAKNSKLTKKNPGNRPPSNQNKQLAFLQQKPKEIQQQSQPRTIKETKVEIDTIQKEEEQQTKKDQQKRAEAVLAELAFLSPMPSLSWTDEDSSSFSSTVATTTNTSVDDYDMIDYNVYNDDVIAVDDSNHEDDFIEEREFYDIHECSSHEQVTSSEDGIKEDELTTGTTISEEEDDDELTPLSHIANSTKEEQLRFLKARNNDVNAASAQLQKYLQWRNDIGLDDCPSSRQDSREKVDEDDWVRATRLAFQYEKKMRKREQEGLNNSDVDDSDESSLCSSSNDPVPSVPPSLPCIVFIDENKGKSNDNSDNHENKNRILQHLPARINPTLTPSTTIYALSLAIYIDLKLSRTSTEKLTVLIDVRTGENWSNTPALKLVPFIKHAATLLNELHPERLHSCIIYPIPTLFSFVYNKMVKPFLDVNTANKISIYGGPAGDYSPMPKGMKECFCDETLERLEQRRLGCFGC